MSAKGIEMAATTAKDIAMARADIQRPPTPQKSPAEAGLLIIYIFTAGTATP